MNISVMPRIMSHFILLAKCCWLVTPSLGNHQISFNSIFTNQNDSLKIFQMNQVQSELRLARSLIAERDSEIQHVRTTNNQVSHWIY